MSTLAEVSQPVVVDEGVAFRVRLADGRRAVAIATRARLGTGEEAQGLALLAAFARRSGDLRAEAAHRLQAGATNPVYLGSR